MTNLAAAIVWTVMCAIGAGWVALALVLPDADDEPESADRCETCGEVHAQP
jgi:hypothetical protein